MMKSLIKGVAVAFTACSALSQGQFNFGNKNMISSPPIDARVYLCDALKAEGTAFWAQAYVKLAGDPDSSYAPVGTAVNFRTGNNAGYIVNRTVTTGWPGGTQVHVQMRVWDAAGGTSYEAAAADGAWRGVSAPVTLTVAEVPAPPPDMVGLQSFSTLYPCPPVPTITRQPADVRVAVGHPFALEVEASDSWARTRYQWYRDAQPISAANQKVLRVASAELTHAGGYFVTVRNFVGGTTSWVARVVVGYPLTLTTNGPGRVEVQPAFDVFEPGQRVELTAVAAEGAAFEGWDGDLSGTTTPNTLTISGPKAVRAWFSRVPLRLEISWQNGKVQLEWTPPAMLQASEALGSGGWQDLLDATSPHDVEPANAQRLYRLRRPRRGRCARLGGEPYDGSRPSGGGHARRTADEHVRRLRPWHRARSRKATMRSLIIAATAALTVGDVLAQRPFILANYESATPRVARVVVGHPLVFATHGSGRIEVQPTCEVFEPGQRVELTAIPAKGPTFERWEGDLSAVANPAVLTMDGPKQVQAWFAGTPCVWTSPGTRARPGSSGPRAAS